MADIRTNLTQQVIEEVRNYFKEKTFQTIIPRSVKLSEAPSFGKPAVIYDPHNRGSVAYVDLGKEFLVRFGSDDDRSNFISTAQENTITTPEEDMKEVDLAPVDERPQTTQANP